jgi:hypothetical protein
MVGELLVVAVPESLAPRERELLAVMLRLLLRLRVGLLLEVPEPLLEAVGLAVRD